MHHIYRTEAFVLRDFAVGEDSRLFSFLTKDLGLVRAKAQGVRLIKSKLRPSLSTFSLVEVELVRGENTWRLVGVREISKASFFRRTRLESFSQIAKLLDRLVHGEEENELLFNEIKMLFSFLSDPSLTTEAEKNIELVFVARVLGALGYFAPKDDLTSPGKLVSGAQLNIDSQKRGELVLAVNSSIGNTHL